VWIDFSNSPHPLLFAPVARRLEALGHEVGVTARDNSQTVELTVERWPQASIIGGQSPKSRVQKAWVMVGRVRSLGRWARGFRADVAVSHNSYGQIVAARALGVPVVTAMDYEGQPANHLAFRLATAILLPEALRGSAVRRQGAAGDRTCFYAGFKEEIYLGDFEPDPSVLEEIGGVPRDRRLVVARTPPSRATYHQFENTLFGEVVEALAGDQGARVVVLVRHPEQREALAALRAGNVFVPDRAVDSRSLMYHADLFVGAGGTMTREAALMGVPTYSLFAGEQPAVDRALEAQGLLRRLRSAGELVPVSRRPAPPKPVEELRARAGDLIDVFVEAIVGSVAAAAR
jgi:predicted glycosyltransferase